MAIYTAASSAAGNRKTWSHLWRFALPSHHHQQLATGENM